MSAVDWYDAFSGPMRIRILGDSLAEGLGASVQEAAAIRPWFVRAVEAYRNDVRVLGLKGYGDTKFGAATSGSLFTRFSWWENDAFGGASIGFDLPILQPAHGTTFTSNGPHGLAVNGLVRWPAWSNPPHPFESNTLYFVESTPSSTTFRLKNTFSGGAVSITGWGRAPFTAVAGIRAAIPAMAASEVSGQRANVILVASGGTNDIGLAVNSGATAAEAADIARSRMSALLDEITSNWPDERTLVLVGGIPDFFPGSASMSTWETKQQAVVAYRASLASDVTARGERFVYKNIWAETSAADNSGDGVHLSLNGYKRAGRVAAEAIYVKTMGATSSRKTPRDYTRLERRPKLLLNTTTGRVTGPSTNIGASTFAVAFSYRPDTGALPADSTNRFMVWLGSADYNTGFGVSSRNTYGVAGRAGIIVYLLGTVMQTSSSGYNADGGLGGYKVLREGEWTDIVVLFNAESLRCVTWLNGELLNNVSVSAAWNIAANAWRIGHTSTALPASQGHYQDFELATGPQLTVAAVAELAKSRLYGRARLPGAIDYRPLSEGAGTSAASTIYQQAAATLSGSATWADANTAVPPWEF